MIAAAQHAVDVPPAAPGPIVLLLIMIVVAGFGYRMWLADQDRVEMERREQFRRDQEAQESWDRTLRAMAPRNYR